MKKNSLKNINDNYSTILQQLKAKIKVAQLRAAQSANLQLLLIYWEIGHAIDAQEQKGGWGAKTVDKLSRDLRLEFPGMKGLSPRNLRYMRNFAKAYPSFQNLAIPAAADRSILQPAVAKLRRGKNLQPAVAKKDSIENLQRLAASIPWTHNIVLLDKVKDSAQRFFYIKKILENGWSKEILIRQIENQLHLRQGKAITNFDNTLPPVQSDLAQETLKSPYLFDFLLLREEAQEAELEKALIQHLKKFMLELGRGFAYVGNQYNLDIGGSDYFLDLLFFNTHMNCFVLFELKVGEFKPEFAGKLNFYVNSVDSEIKQKQHKPTIGVLLCKTPNETVVKYALQGIRTPLGVANYKLSPALPDEFKADLPSAQEFEEELQKEVELLLKSPEQKLQNLKMLIGSLAEEEVKEKYDASTPEKIFNKVVLPLKKNIEAASAEVFSLFDETGITFMTDSSGHNAVSQVREYLKKHPHIGEFRLEFRLKGLKKAGTKTFNLWKTIYVSLDEYNYRIRTAHNYDSKVLEKLYHQLPGKAELKNLAEGIAESLIDEITMQVERIRKEKI